MRRSGSTTLLAAAMLVATACAGGPATEGGDDADSDRSPSPTVQEESSPQASPDSSASSPASPPPARGSVKVTSTVTEELDSPWGLAPLDEGDLLVSSRDTGKITRIDGENGKKTELGEVPGVEPGGEGGLLGIAVKDAYVYAYFTSASDNRIVRMLYSERKAEGKQLGAPSTVFSGLPKAGTHNGGRIAFGPDGMLYVGTGDAGVPDRAQDKESPAGKILRMQPDGSPPEEGNAEKDSVVYSLGHRNVQGLAWDRQKRLWASEFGQNEWDEVNLVEPGENYGWPEVEGKEGQKGFTDPLAQWTTKEASPSGLAWAKGSLWMAGLRGERLWRIPLDGEKQLAKPQAFLEGDYGRLRTVVSDGSDGLWLVTSNTDGRGSPEDTDDRILKLKVR